MPTFAKKTVYHSQLVSAGPIVVKILSDITKSKYPKDGRDQYYVSFSHEGSEHQYICESRDCENSLRNLKGKTVCIEATGSRDDARIDVTAASAGSEAPHRQEGMRDEPRHEQHTEPRREPVLGQTVGMAINNAVRLVSSTDESKKLDYVLSPEFSRSVFIVASDLIRISKLLEKGDMAKPAKERGQTEKRPEPEPEPEPEDLDEAAEIPF